MVVLKTLACDSAAPRAAGGRHSANCTPTYRRRARTVLFFGWRASDPWLGGRADGARPQRTAPSTPLVAQSIPA